MSYKNLKNFRSIFNRDDFSYISDIAHISQLSEIILYNLSSPDGSEPNHIKLLKAFLDSLEAFCEWINCSSIPPIGQGYILVEQELIRIIKILMTPELKRRAISKGYSKKFNKSFLYGLSMVLEGIREAFNPDVIKDTKIEKEQLIRYFFDKTEGLGHRFLFNQSGKDGAANKIFDLNRDELILVMRLLLKPGRQIRSYNGWLDFGRRNFPIRVLAIKPPIFFGKLRVFSIFKKGEHEDYERALSTTPSNVQFSAA